jgi:hypothetical protein
MHLSMRSAQQLETENILYNYIFNIHEDPLILSSHMKYLSNFMKQIRSLCVYPSFMKLMLNYIYPYLSLAFLAGSIHNIKMPSKMPTRRIPTKYKTTNPLAKGT